MAVGVRAGVMSARLAAALGAVFAALGLRPVALRVAAQAHGAGSPAVAAGEDVNPPAVAGLTRKFQLFRPLPGKFLRFGGKWRYLHELQWFLKGFPRRCQGCIHGVETVRIR